MIELLQFISYLLTLYVYILVAAAILSWLIAFNVVNTHSPVVATIADFLWRITEPVLRPIRHRLPTMAMGLDLSPMVVILAIYFLDTFLVYSLRDLALSLR